MDDGSLSLSHRGEPGLTAHGNDEVPHRSVLDVLGTRLGEVPRVLLLETDADTTIVGPAEGLDGSIPEDVGRYHLLSRIDGGGMGDIFRGRDTDLGREIAIKALRQQYREDTALGRRLVEEAQIGGQLQHPGVVPVYELGTLADGRPFFTMKLVKGRRLSDLLTSRPSVTEDLAQFLTIFQQVCQTMAYAHARGVIHRDLKPSNIMVGNFGEVQVIDWGLAKVLPRDQPVEDLVTPPDNQTVVATSPSGHERAKTLVGSAMGTPAYMAPE
jgi:serine/threonine-protein kinase